jgi:TetR/AcrR family transcriptional regulator, transcriptional repressor for nem operon
MARPSKTSREHFVITAMRLFGEKGYGGTSIADILHATGANAGSLYHQFPTKQEVLIAVLATYRKHIGPMLLEPAWEQVKDPIDRIFALLAAYRRKLSQTDCSYGCPIGSLALELHEPDPDVRKLLAANFRGWVRAIEGCLHRAGKRIPRTVNRRELASFVLTTMEGGVMLARTHRSLAPFDAAVARLRDYFSRLESSVPATPRRSPSR